MAGYPSEYPVWALKVNNTHVESPSHPQDGTYTMGNCKTEKNAWETKKK